MAYKEIVDGLYRYIRHMYTCVIKGRIIYDECITDKLRKINIDITKVSNNSEFQEYFKSTSDVHNILECLKDEYNIDVHLRDLIVHTESLYVKELKAELFILREQKNKSDELNVQLLLINAEYKRHLMNS